MDIPSSFPLYVVRKLRLISLWRCSDRYCEEIQSKTEKCVTLPEAVSRGHVRGRAIQYYESKVLENSILRKALYIEVDP